MSTTLDPRSQQQPSHPPSPSPDLSSTSQLAPKVLPRRRVRSRPRRLTTYCAAAVLLIVAVWGLRRWYFADDGTATEITALVSGGNLAFVVRE